MSTLELRDQLGGAEALSGASPSRAEARGFESDELKPLTVPQLRNLIRDQLDNVKAPLPKSWKLSKASKAALIQVLTDPAYGFTTRKPKLVFERGVGVQKQKHRVRNQRETTGMNILSPMPATVSPAHSQQGGCGTGHAFESPVPAPPAAQTTRLEHDPTPSSALPGEGEAVMESRPGNFDESSFGGFSIENLFAFDLPPERITLTLYVLDERSPAPLPDMVKVTVGIVRNLAGGAVANWNDVLRELQKTASAIHGSNLKLSYSRSDKDNYKIAILQSLALPVDKATIVEADLLVDESFPVYRLHVEHLTPTSPIPRRAPTPDVQAALEIMARYSSSHPSGMRTMPQLRKRGNSRVLVKEDAAARDKEWLQEQVSKRDGYEVMAKKHDTKMSYARVAQQWAFAVSCLDEFTKRRFPHSNGQIYSYHVWDALSRKGTWCLAAKEGHRLYQEHVDHPDVAEAVSDTSRKGHLGFLALLRQVEGE